MTEDKRREEDEETKEEEKKPLTSHPAPSLPGIRTSRNIRNPSTAAATNKTHPTICKSKCTQNPHRPRLTTAIAIAPSGNKITKATLARMPWMLRCFVVVLMSKPSPTSSPEPDEPPTGLPKPSVPSPGPKPPPPPNWATVGMLRVAAKY